jgi:hypothetical protein
MFIPRTLLTRIVVLAVAQFVWTAALAEGEKTAAPARHPPPEYADSGVGAFHRAIAGLTTPEFEQRNRTRRLLQQQGYVMMLQDVIQHDGLGALISYLKMRAQLDFHLPQNTLMLFVPVVQPPQSSRHLPPVTGAPSSPMGFPLLEDRTFPPDPWKR